MLHPVQQKRDLLVRALAKLVCDGCPLAAYPGPKLRSSYGVSWKRLNRDELPVGRLEGYRNCRFPRPTLLEGSPLCRSWSRPSPQPPLMPDDSSVGRTLGISCEAPSLAPASSASSPCSAARRDACVPDRWTASPTHLGLGLLTLDSQRANNHGELDQASMSRPMSPATALAEHRGTANARITALARLAVTISCHPRFCAEVIVHTLARPRRDRAGADVRALPTARHRVPIWTANTHREQVRRHVLRPADGSLPPRPLRPSDRAPVPRQYSTLKGPSIRLPAPRPPPSPDQLREERIHWRLRTSDPARDAVDRHASRPDSRRSPPNTEISCEAPSFTRAASASSAFFHRSRDEAPGCVSKAPALRPAIVATSASRPCAWPVSSAPRGPPYESARGYQQVTWPNQRS